MVGIPQLPGGPEEKQKAQKSSQTIQEVTLCVKQKVASSQRKYKQQKICAREENDRFQSQCCRMRAFQILSLFLSLCVRTHKRERETE